MALFLVFEVRAADDRLTNHAAFFVDAYGLADASTEPLVARAYQIFSQIKAVAAVQGRHTPRLKVLGTSGSPWALALPDGAVLLSRGALDICYRAADEDLGDTRLAFVFGHELAHLADNDFWSAEVYRSLADDQLAPLRRLLHQTTEVGPGRLAEIQLKETKADDGGFFYAAVAGYPVHRLLGDPASDRSDFFQFWSEQTEAGFVGDGTHPPPEERAAWLRQRLSQMLGAIELWRFGVRLLQADRLDDARYFLDAFQEHFPSREVYGNLGYLSLRQAMQRMPQKVATRFWMPIQFDLDTRADSLGGASVTRNAAGLTSEVIDLLETARSALERSVELDPDYMPGWSNLAVTHFFLGDIHLARDAVDRALARRQENGALSALQAAIIAETDPTLDLWPQAIERLETLLAHQPQAAAAHYNLARLLDERGRAAAAAPHWAWLRARAGELPTIYADVVCRFEGGARHAECPATRPRSRGLFPWPLPIQPGVDLYQDTEVAEQLTDSAWQRLTLRFGTAKMDGALFWQPDRFAVLVLGGYVDTFVLYGADLGTAVELRKRVGAPHSIRTLPGAEIWQYGGWAAVIRSGQVTEAWAMNASPY
ncbi:M48 family metalloprotease [Thiorhodococcus drewsii]|uniref:M48 family metalloprotease n=1 Tax=Thiorhodococcus drewsii TaxID=210408 RepID=UPI0002D76D6E|nr:M48 family metalloprotease [Thiorhodococcus drewsii]